MWEMLCLREVLCPGAGVAGWELAVGGVVVVAASSTSFLVDMGPGISGPGMQECQEWFGLVARTWVQKKKTVSCFLTVWSE